MQPERAIATAFALRAEQLRDSDLFRLFHEPPYAHELHGPAPCVLIGGRGSGKTTLLRGLAVDGYRQLHPESKPTEWPYFGAYLRINTGRVGAFSGPEQTAEDWSRLFAHYVNLRLCLSAAECWSSLRELDFDSFGNVDPVELKSVWRALGVELPDAGPDRLVDVLETEIDAVELYINSIGSPLPMAFSATSLGRPIEELLKAMRRTTLVSEKPFFFLIDEYENLDSDQQRVVNTLIKQAGTLYTFKVGMRAYGWKTRQTLNAGEALQAPADYELVPIETRLTDSPHFSALAQQICQTRISHAAELLGLEAPAIRNLFPRITTEDEAELLGVRARIDHLAKRHGVSVDKLDSIARTQNKGNLFAFFLLDWMIARDLEPAAFLAEVESGPDTWMSRYSNYRGSLLFRIRSGKVGIRKYYAGWTTLDRLSGANFRFLVQIVRDALQDHATQNPEAWHETAISPEIQTEAAIQAARDHLSELDGVSLQGARVTRLTVALGRLFQLLAQTAGNHTPDVTQFRISRDRSELEVGGAGQSDIIREAVRHLAIRELPSTKIANLQVADPDYMLHPVLASLFLFSPARKRKLIIEYDEIEQLINEPAHALRTILARQNRPSTLVDDELPETLTLFSGFIGHHD